MIQGVLGAIWWPLWVIWRISSHFGSIFSRFGIPPDPILGRFWLFLLIVFCFASFKNQSQNLSTYTFFHENCSKRKFSSKPFLQEIITRPAVTQAKQDAQTTKPPDLQLGFGGMRGAFEFKSSRSRKSMKAKMHGKTKPRQERIVDIRNVTDKSSIFSQN